MKTLEGVAVGDVIYWGRRLDDLKTVTVEKVGKVHIVAAGMKFNIDTGAKVSTREKGIFRTYARKETPEIKAHKEHQIAIREFEKALASFRAVPQTVDRLKIVTDAILDGAA